MTKDYINQANKIIKENEEIFKKIEKLNEIEKEFDLLVLTSKEIVEFLVKDYNNVDNFKSLKNKYKSHFFNLKTFINMEEISIKVI